METHDVLLGRARKVVNRRYFSHSRVMLRAWTVQDIRRGKGILRGERLASAHTGFPGRVPRSSLVSSRCACALSTPHARRVDSGCASATTPGPSTSRSSVASQSTQTANQAGHPRCTERCLPQRTIGGQLAGHERSSERFVGRFGDHGDCGNLAAAAKFRGAVWACWLIRAIPQGTEWGCGRMGPDATGRTPQRVKGEPDGRQVKPAPCARCAGSF